MPIAPIEPTDSPDLLRGLPPVIDRRTRLLVLGSFPSVASLQAGQYYAHPRNHFWPLLSALWNVDLRALAYPRRLQEVLQRGLGIWDVYAHCRREGSLDSAIRNAEVNDFAALRAQCPQLQLIVHNGGESFRHAKRVRASLGVEHFPLVQLPSTSPANASWSFERKLEAWREAVVWAGLL